MEARKNEGAKGMRAGIYHRDTETQRPMEEEKQLIIAGFSMGCGPFLLFFSVSPCLCGEIVGLSRFRSSALPCEKDYLAEASVRENDNDTDNRPVGTDHADAAAAAEM